MAVQLRSKSSSAERYPDTLKELDEELSEKDQNDDDDDTASSKAKIIEF